MHFPMQMWFVLGTIALLVVVIYILVATIKQRILAHHLALLAEDIQTVGLATLTKESLRCTMCKNASHVHVWQYGDEDTFNEVLLCYLCASRIAKLLQPPSLPKGGHPHYDQHHQRREQPFNRSRSR